MRLSPTQQRACAALDRFRATADSRDALIRAAREVGVPITEIARRAGLSRQHVHAILAADPAEFPEFNSLVSEPGTEFP